LPVMKTIGSPGYVKLLQTEAARLGLSATTGISWPVETVRICLKQCRQAHVGLAFMPLSSDDPNEQAMVGASNKPFDYLACGLALLVSDLPDWQKMFVETGCGAGLQSG